MVQLSKLLAPKEREFFDLFEEAGANIVRAAALLERMLDKWPDHGELARDIVVCEQEGDRITHDIVHRLNQTFVTPIDREDIYALASGLDDIVDWIEEVADFFALYRIEAPMSQAQIAIIAGGCFVLVLVAYWLGWKQRGELEEKCQRERDGDFW